MEDSLHDIESMRHFAGVSLEAVPDESSLQRLEAYNATEKLFSLTSDYLTKKGLLLKEAIVDATIISAPRSTKSKARETNGEPLSLRIPHDKPNALNSRSKYG